MSTSCPQDQQGSNSSWIWQGLGPIAIYSVVTLVSSKLYNIQTNYRNLLSSAPGLNTKVERSIVWLEELQHIFGDPGFNHVLDESERTRIQRCLARLDQKADAIQRVLSAFLESPDGLICTTERINVI